VIVAMIRAMIESMIVAMISAIFGAIFWCNDKVIDRDLIEAVPGAKMG